MKIELDENDIKYINRVNQDLADGECPPLFCEIGKDYYINFTCLDRAKANNFILSLCAPNPDITKEVEEKFGVRFNSINYCKGDNKITELKGLLQSFLNALDNI